MGDVGVRRYCPADREAVRRICFRTGYMGDPVAWQWADQESFADLFTRWYTDHEPECALVAVRDGEVVGYLLGCRDTRRADSFAATGGWRMLRRGLLVRPGTAPVLWRSIGDLAAAALRGRPIPTGLIDDRWPAHLHIDLLPEARAKGVGRTLITRWLDDLSAADVRGCHLETWAENDGAIAFFRGMGFVPHGPPRPMPGIRSPEGQRHHTLVMVHSLRPRPSESEDSAAGPAPDQRACAHDRPTEASSPGASRR